MPIKMLRIFLFIIIFLLSDTFIVWSQIIFIPPVLNGPKYVLSGEPFILTWTAVSGAEFYTIELSTDKSFSVPTTEYIVTSNSISLQKIVSLTTIFYFRVKAGKIGSYVSAWSNIINISVFSFSYKPTFELLRRGWGWDLSQLSDPDNSLPQLNLPWDMVLNYEEKDFPPDFDELKLVVLGFNDSNRVWSPLQITSKDSRENRVHFDFNDFNLTLFVIASSPSHQSSNIRLVTNKDTLFSGDTISILIKIGYNYPVTDLHELFFAVKYDESLAKFLGITEVDVSTADFYFTTISLFSKIYVNLHGYENNSIYGNGTLAEVLFLMRDNAESERQATFQLTDVIAKNSADSTIVLDAGTTVVNIALKRGDLNSDGKVDIFDLIKLLKILGGSESSTDSSDINNDGKTDIFDLLGLLKLIAR
jgi:hypothetical protein